MRTKTDTATTRWIPVTQALPETDQLVFASDGVAIFMASYASDLPAMDWIVVFGPIPARGVHVTHWMPFPDLPPHTAH